jgi:tetratricopeptide (TPR) repeat protein
MLYEANGLYPLALASYERLLERYPGDAELWYRLGRCREREGDLDGAIAALEHSAAELASPGQVHELLVRWLLQSGRLDEASDLVGGMASDEERFVQLAKARVLVAEGQLQEGEALLSSSGLLKSPLARPALLLLSDIRRRSGKPDEATLAAQQARDSPPDPLHPWDRGVASYRLGSSNVYRRAQAQIQRGDPEGALATLEKLQGKPEGADPRVASMRAHCYLLLGRSHSAIELLKEVAAEKPESFQTQLNLAKAILVGMRQGVAGADLAAAGAAIDEALRLRPDAASAWTARGQILEAAGKSDEALEAYHEGWSRDSQDPTPRILGAEIHLARGDWDRARELLLPVTEALDSSPSALLARARAEAELQHLDTARALIDRIGDALPADRVEAVRDRLEELGANLDRSPATVG